MTQPAREIQPPAADQALPETICFTSFTLAYLSRARVMAQTVKAAHPNWAPLVDELPPELDLNEALAPFDRVVPADALNIPAFPAWMFKHDVVGGCTAVKPTMLLALLQAGRARGRADKIISLDPDIAVFHALTDIEMRLDTASVVLTPHQLSANDPAHAIADNEMTSLKYGTFNLGFIAVRNDATGHGFAQWWARMTRAACYDDIPAGIFTGQKYCNIASALFEGVHIERDPGCNVASWNLSRRKLCFRPEGGLTVNGSPLKFYHSTKIGGIGDVMTERYAHENTEVYEVLNWYKRQVQRNTIPGAESHPWRYASFANGQTVPCAARLLWRQHPDLAANFIDPFRVGAGSFHAWLQREYPEMLTTSRN